MITKTHSIQNSFVNGGDDCISFKPGNFLYFVSPAVDLLTISGSTNIYVQNLTCFETAGIAVGSLGQYQVNHNPYQALPPLVNKTDLSGPIRSR